MKRAEAWAIHPTTNRKLFLATCIVSLVALSGGSSVSTKKINVRAGQAADLWFGINVTGKVHFAIRTRDGNNKTQMWWIMEPLGTVKRLGTVADHGTLEIPGKMKGSISAKLRGKALVDTIVYIGENVEVDNSLTFSW
jgi:hypothetical protein